MTGLNFEDLRDYILDKNPYFKQGFANAFKVKNIGNDSNGVIFSKNKGGDLVAVSPQDTFGNYFYLRNEEGINLKAVGQMTAEYPLYTDEITVHCVGFLKDADSFLVVNNVRNTLLMYKNNAFRAFPNKSVWNREQIIIEELSGVRDEDIAAALQRLNNYTVFKITFVLTAPFIVSTCIKDICVPCGT